MFGLLPLLACSCVNPYSQYYNGTTDARKLPNYIPTDEALQIYGTDNFDRDTATLIRKGYSPIGQSSFSAGSGMVSDKQLREQAAKIGAHVVLISSKYSHTVYGATTLTVPQTTTSYSTANATAYGPGGTVNAYGSGSTTTYGSQTIVMPYSVDRSDFDARYFIKSKLRLGITPEPVSDEMRRRIQTNRGVSVLIVTENTPAFAADVLPGDVILSIGEDQIQSVENFYQIVEQHEGQKTKFRINRDGAIIEKEIGILSFTSDRNLQYPTNPQQKP